MKNVLFKVGRKIWRLYGEFLPATVKKRIRRAYCRYLENQHLLDGDAHGLVLNAQMFDSQLKKNIENARLRCEGQPDDGMQDYPITRPHLAFDYISGLVRWLADSEYKLISYNDLAVTPQYGFEKEEFQKWIVVANNCKEKAILLQYDVDARPDVTTALLKTHIACDVPGNVMIFNKKIYDWKLRREGIVEVDRDYELDFATFDNFQKVGGVVGYHCNAFDRSGGNMERALEIFHEDVAELRKYVDLKFFSMHGGHVTNDGCCNASMEIQPYLEKLGLTWVHNGNSVFFHSCWSDGSASNPPYRNECNNPLDFIRSTGTGQRSRLLFHPQYYNDMSNLHFDFPILQDQKWVYDTRNLTESGDFDGEKYWQSRWQESIQRINTFDSFFISPVEERPVFVNGMSRSGTTLLVSMFDAHPDGAMAYESYPRYLYIPSDEGILTTEEYIYTYQVLLNYPEAIAFQLLNRPPLRNLMTFAAVTSWTGMTTQQTGELLRAYLTKHHRISGVQEALKVVAASARFKVRNQGAKFWGTKCQGNFEEYFALWPQARLIYIVRSGLDILASQKINGAFNPDAKVLGKNWRSHYEHFIQFREDNPELAISQIQYEQLVNMPEKNMRRVCDEIGLSYHPQMALQHELKTTLTENPRGQLSAERVQQPIDNKSVNRWKEVLSQRDVDTFLEGCGGSRLFEEFGMEWEF